MKRAIGPTWSRRPTGGRHHSHSEQRRALCGSLGLGVVLFVDHDVEMSAPDEARDLLLGAVGFPAGVGDLPAIARRVSSFCASPGGVGSTGMNACERLSLSRSRRITVNAAGSPSCQERSSVSIPYSASQSTSARRFRMTLLGWSAAGHPKSWLSSDRRFRRDLRHSVDVAVPQDNRSEHRRPAREAGDDEAQRRC